MMIDFDPDKTVTAAGRLVNTPRYARLRHSGHSVGRFIVLLYLITAALHKFGPDCCSLSRVTGRSRYHDAHKIHAVLFYLAIIVWRPGPVSHPATGLRIAETAAVISGY